MSFTQGTVQTNHTQGPSVYIDELVFQKIMHWINKSNNEVSGLGKIVMDADGDIRVIDAMLLPQRNTGSTTDIEGEDVAKAMYLMRETEGELKFWWHSHVDFSVFWSGTDMSTIKKLPGNEGWFVCTVFNKRQEMRSCVTMVNHPFTAIIDMVPTQIVRSLPEELVKEWDHEYEEKVTKVLPKPVPQVPHSSIPQRFPHAMMGDLERDGLMDSGHPLDRIFADDDWPGFSMGGGERSSRPVHAASHADAKLLLEKREQLEDMLDEVENELELMNQAGLVSDEELMGSRKFADEMERGG